LSRAKISGASFCLDSESNDENKTGRKVAFHVHHAMIRKIDVRVYLLPLETHLESLKDTFAEKENMLSIRIFVWKESKSNGVQRLDRKKIPQSK